MLIIDNLTKTFKSKTVLENISLTVRHGEIVSILGRSGSGKSTLLNLIAGFERSDEGSIYLEEKVLSAKEYFVDPSKRSIGFVFQNYALFPHLNVADNIAFSLSRIPKEEKSKRVGELLRLIGLEGYGSKYPDTLSGGEQQRVALARVLAMRPSVILFDEPFSNVDTVLKTSIRDELLAILRSGGSTALFVTHDPHEAMAISDRIAYIDEGKIVQFDTPEMLYHAPANENVAAFFGPINRYEGGFVRVEKCRIDSDGPIRAEVVSSRFMGNTYETQVRFTQKEYDCRFLIYTDRLFTVGEIVRIGY
ncbi:ABC transporter ATP-binding protein [uncultured Sulfuricurvum sp.]|uniref:ABC transporter ATP-binding protein n=1 Tax=uncultured Sulfuricurvum sp. TaxID=430693 RepID=UPI00261F6C05|nr:ABC transporter ATP-binding protein [uncultured Sulfuricurvum sp.]